MFLKKLVLCLMWLSTVDAVAATSALLKFELSVIELDTIRYDTGIVTARFLCTNISDKPVSILQVSPQCACTVPRFSAAAVPPGRTAAIEVDLDPSELYGEQNRHLTVYSTNGDYRRFNTITVRAYVERDQSEGEIRFPFHIGEGLRTETSTVGLNAASKCEITVYNDNPFPIRLRASGSRRLSLDCPETVESHSRATITASFNDFLYWKREGALEVELFVNDKKCENSILFRIRRK